MASPIAIVDQSDRQLAPYSDPLPLFYMRLSTRPGSRTARQRIIFVFDADKIGDAHDVSVKSGGQPAHAIQIVWGHDKPTDLKTSRWVSKLMSKKELDPLLKVPSYELLDRVENVLADEATSRYSAIIAERDGLALTDFKGIQTLYNLQIQLPEVAKLCNSMERRGNYLIALIEVEREPSTIVEFPVSAIDSTISILHFVETDFQCQQFAFRFDLPQGTRRRMSGWLQKVGMFGHSELVSFSTPSKRDATKPPELQVHNVRTDDQHLSLLKDMTVGEQFTAMVTYREPTVEFHKSIELFFMPVYVIVAVHYLMNGLHWLNGDPHSESTTQNYSTTEHHPAYWKEALVAILVIQVLIIVPRILMRFSRSRRR